MSVQITARSFNARDVSYDSGQKSLLSYTFTCRCGAHFTHDVERDFQVGDGSGE